MLYVGFFLTQLIIWFFFLVNTTEPGVLMPRLQELGMSDMNSILSKKIYMQTSQQQRKSLQF